ncbi:hypothetical protein [Taklimakanibacter albus]|uniref:Uncharacterized protein n=1 Tax=Taklimakanibacter albus TaxID=2800327 RepID=A0ACC5RGF3_9HYPH|nr:hypothetical protein [Aestuariivirga sp. YIM B02566]MBK1871555.1 hypothetical protein [Aestuariivirga sp. YIM B02566]
MITLLVIALVWLWVVGAIGFYGLLLSAHGNRLRQVPTIVGAAFWPITLPVLAVIYFIGELRDWMDRV